MEKGFNKSFRTFKALYDLTNNLPRKSTNAQTCFWKQVVFSAKKAVDNQQKDQLSFGTVQLILKKDLHFFLYGVSVVHEITP
jgi:hypothetical protein